MAYAAQNGRGRKAVAAIVIAVRCAIYTRKSTDEGLDREFNTLEAQRASGEAYISSQQGEGWICLSDRYDDGGFSGATMSRPGMQRLRADVEAGLIDCIVVYKLDRLSRNVRDYLNFLAFLDEHNVAFVSVTQQFNTSTPLGRMTLKQLLLFAEFERDMTAERTRDKMRAARRRGKWTGGMPPLGYDVVAEGGKLGVNRDESEEVRAIFELYAEMRSLIGVAEVLNRRGWRRKSWTTKDGKRRHGKPWDRESLRHVLINPLYAGMQKLGHETFPGEHPAIIPKALFQRVQKIHNENGRSSASGHRNRHDALLRGLLRCASCDRAMAHQWTRSHGRLYRYYVCQRAMKEGWSACPTKSVPALEIEQFVIDRIRGIGRDPELRRATFEQALTQVAAERRGLKAEAKRVDREFVTGRADVERLVLTLTRASRAAADAIQVEVGKAQERVATLEQRSAEIAERSAVLEAQKIDEANMACALESFDPVWDALLTPEKERVLRLLIERVAYDGATKQMQIRFALPGFAALAADLASAESTS